MTELLGIFFLRIGQALLLCLPTLLTGVVLAALTRELLGYENLGLLFGDTRGWRGALRAWFISTLVPVCSFGVLPMADELRRAGVRRSSIIAFMVGAPTVNLWTLIYSASENSPLQVGTLLLGKIIFSVAIAWIVSRNMPDVATPEAENGGGLTAALFALPKILSGRWIGDVGFGLLGLAVTALLIHPGYFGDQLLERTWWNISLFTPAAMAAYVTPETGMMLVRQIFDEGGTPGAALTVLIVGSGMTLTTFSYIWRTVGKRACLRGIFASIVVAILLAHAADKLLFDAVIDLSDTHALDMFGMPYHLSRAGESIPTAVYRQWVAIFQRPQQIAAAILLAGVALRWIHAPKRRISDRLLAGRAISRPVMVTTLGLGVLVGVVGAVYIYYGPPDHMVPEIRRHQAEALSSLRSNRPALAHQHLIRMAGLMDRLTIASRLRFKPPDEAVIARRKLLQQEYLKIASALAANGHSEAEASLIELMPASRDWLRDYVQAIR